MKCQNLFKGVPKITPEHWEVVENKDNKIYPYEISLHRNSSTWSSPSWLITIANGFSKKSYLVITCQFICQESASRWILQNLANLANSKTDRNLSHPSITSRHIRRYFDILTISYHFWISKLIPSHHLRKYSDHGFNESKETLSKLPKLSTLSKLSKIVKNLQNC